MQLNLHHIKVSGYKNVVNAKINLDDVTALVGLNGCGKSNIISAVEYGIHFMQSPFKFKMMNERDKVPLLHGHQAMDYSFEIEAEYHHIWMKYGFSFEWATDSNQHPSVTEEHLLIRNSSSQKYSTVMKRNKTTAKYKSSEKGRCDRMIPLQSHDLMINICKNFPDTFFFYEIIKALNEMQFCVESHLKKYPYSIEILRNHQAKSLASDIPRIIYELKNEHQTEYHVLMDTFKQLFPTIEWIEPSGKIFNEQKNSHCVYTEHLYFLFVKDRNLVQPIHFDYLPDGIKRVFLTLTFSVLADIYHYSAIVIENPENSVHPCLLQTYIRQLHALSGECKIIFTSHSPYLIQYIPPEKIYVGLLCPSGQVELRKIVKSKALMKEASKNDQTVGELIFNYMSFSNANEMLEEYLEKSSASIQFYDAVSE